MLAKTKILICGVLPPPYFGHSMLYETLMGSSFPDAFVVRFLNMHFWSYETDKKITFSKLGKLLKYYKQFLWAIITFQPEYVLYNMSDETTPMTLRFIRNVPASGWKDLLSGNDVHATRDTSFVRFGGPVITNVPISLKPFEIAVLEAR